MNLLMRTSCLILLMIHCKGKETGQVGVRMVLHETYLTLFLKYHGNIDASLDVYLQTFLNAVGLFFHDLQNPILDFVLVGTYNMTANDSDTFLASQKTGNNKEGLDLLHDLGISQNFSSDDLVLLLHPYPWQARYELNTSYFDGFCAKRAYGFVQDDTKSFSGVTMAARQFARLLGANADKISGCKDSTYLMANSRTSPDKHTLSNCSRKDIQIKLEKIKHSSCLRTNYSRPVNSTYLPSDFLTEKDTCTLKNENYTFCNHPRTEHTKAFLVGCSIACCEKDAKNVYVILAPDGTQSDKCQLCLAGNCAKESVTSSSSTRRAGSGE